MWESGSRKYWVLSGWKACVSVWSCLDWVSCTVKTFLGFPFQLLNIRLKWASTFLLVLSQCLLCECHFGVLWFYIRSTDQKIWWIFRCHLIVHVYLLKTLRIVPIVLQPKTAKKYRDGRRARRYFGHLANWCWGWLRQVSLSFWTPWKNQNLSMCFLRASFHGFYSKAQGFQMPFFAGKSGHRCLIPSVHRK